MNVVLIPRNGSTSIVSALGLHHEHNRTGDGSPRNQLNASAVYSAVTLNPGGATPSAEQGTGTHGRFAYIVNPRGLAVVNAVNQPMYFFKCATAL